MCVRQGTRLGERARRKVLRSVPYGAFVVGTNGRDGPHLMFGNWFTQASFDPPLVVLSFEGDSRTLALVRSRKRFAVSFLAKDGSDIANAVLAGSPVQTASTPLGLPVVKGAWGWIECELSRTVTTGDHVLVVAEVTDASVSDRAGPLTLAETGMSYGG